MAERILLIEDDRELGAQVLEHLRDAGFETEWWTEGRPLTAADATGTQLLILDLMLPGSYGMAVLKALRTFSDMPVLILSARNDSFDKVRALKLGADDYLTKRFWPEELIQRVHARLRRPAMQRERALELGPVKLELESRTAFVAGEPVTELTRVEFEILAALMRRPDAAVTRRWLVEHVLDPDRDGTQRTLDVHISRIRKKRSSGESVVVKSVGSSHEDSRVHGASHAVRYRRREPPRPRRRQAA